MSSKNKPNKPVIVKEFTKLGYKLDKPGNNYSDFYGAYQIQQPSLVYKYNQKVFNSKTDIGVFSGLYNNTPIVYYNLPRFKSNESYFLKLYAFKRLMYPDKSKKIKLSNQLEVLTPKDEKHELFYIAYALSFVDEYTAKTALKKYHSLVFDSLESKAPNQALNWLGTSPYKLKYLKK